MQIEIEQTEVSQPVVLDLQPDITGERRQAIRERINLQALIAAKTAAHAANTQRLQDDVIRTQGAHLLAVRVFNVKTEEQANEMLTLHQKLARIEERLRSSAPAAVDRWKQSLAADLGDATRKQSHALVLGTTADERAVLDRRIGALRAHLEDEAIDALRLQCCSDDDVVEAITPKVEALAAL